jgi:hypothetical protein
MKIKALANQHECEYPDCKNFAVDIVFNRDKWEIGFYCSEHVNQIINIGDPEYIEQCPNCECFIPIN